VSRSAVRQWQAEQGARRHCSIKAKGALAMPRSGEEGPSGTLENRNNRASEGLLHGFCGSRWISWGGPIV
jgi:hypothetical protein